MREVLSFLNLLRSDIFFNVLEKVTSVGLKLLILFLIIKVAGSEEQGIYKYIIDTAMIFNIIVLFGLDNYSIYLTTKFFKNKELESVHAVITHNLLWCLATFFPMLAIVYLSTYYFSFLRPIVSNFVLLITFLAFSFQSRMLVKNMWVGVGSIVYNSIYQIISEIILAGVVVVAFFKQHFSSYNTIFLFASVNVFFMLFTLVQLILRTNYRFAINYELFKKHIKGGFSIFLYTIFFTCMLRIDSIIVMKSLGPKFTSYYGIASQYSEFVYFIVIAVSQIIIKETALNDFENLSTWLKKVQWTQIAVLLILLVFCPLIPTVFGEEYTNSIIPAIILLIGTYFLGIFIFFTYYNFGLNRLKVLVISSCIGFLINLLGNLLLIQSFGIVGSSIASSISYFSALIVLIFLSKTKSGEKVNFRKYLIPF